MLRFDTDYNIVNYFNKQSGSDCSIKKSSFETKAHLCSTNKHNI